MFPKLPVFALDAATADWLGEPVSRLRTSKALHVAAAGVSTCTKLSNSKRKLSFTRVVKFG